MSYEWEATATGQARRFGTAEVATLTDSLFVTLGSDATNNNAPLALGVEYTFTVHARSSLGDGESASTAVKAMPTVTLTLGDGTATTATIAENAADNDADTDSVLVVARLTQASAEDVTVTVTVSDDEALEVSNAEIVIRAGSLTSDDTATVKAKDNETAEANEDVTVSAEADNANDPADDAITITIANEDTAPGAAPAVTAASRTGGFLLTWTFSDTDWGNAEETTRRFEYQVVADGGTFADDGWEEVPGGGDARSFLVTGQTAGNYDVQVRAATAAGAGDASSTADATAN